MYCISQRGKKREKIIRVHAMNHFTIFVASFFHQKVFTKTVHNKKVLAKSSIGEHFILGKEKIVVSNIMG